MKSLLVIGMLSLAFTANAVEVPAGMSIKNLNVELFPAVFGKEGPSKLCVTKVSGCTYEVEKHGSFKGGIFAKAIVQVRDARGLEGFGEASNTDYRFKTVNLLFNTDEGQTAACRNLISMLKKVSCTRNEELQRDHQYLSDQLTNIDNI